MNFENLNANYKWAISLAVMLTLWMASGFLATKKSSDADSNAKVGERELFTVQTKKSIAQSYRLPVKVSGRSEAKRSVVVSAEIEGRLIATPAVEGTQVKAGDVLCVIDSEDRLLRQEQAKAQFDKAQIDFEGALRLKDKGYQSKTQIAAAKANLALAEAQLKASTLAYAKRNVRAPFDGVIQEHLADPGTYLQKGAACARFIELSPLSVVGYVPEADVSSLSLGDKARVVFLSGDQHEGSLVYVSRSADEATRTFKIEIELKNESLALSDGLSADMEILTNEVSAHLIPPSLLSLDQGGRLGIKILDEKNTVSFLEVDLLGDDPNGVWVSGLPDSATIIVVGQEYVSPGAEVNVVEVDASQPTLAIGSDIL